MVYVAAPLPCLLKAREIAALLTEAGYVIASTWHRDVKPGSVDSPDPTDRTIALMGNLEDLRSADLVVAYLAGAELPRTTFGEIGFAYALHKPVIMALPPGPSPNRCILDAHPLCTVYTSTEAMLETVARVVAQMGAK